LENKNMTPDSSVPHQEDRREFLRKAMYIAPVLLTLPAMPGFAQIGSGGGGGQCPDGQIFIDVSGPNPFDPDAPPLNQIPIEEGGILESFCAS
jgi:hypothetical protein